MDRDSLINTKKTLYQVLNLTPDVTHEEIFQTYRKLVLKYHPDKLQKPTDEEILEYVRIQEAYQYLSSDRFRAIYKKHRWNFSKSKDEFYKNSSRRSENDDELEEKNRIQSIDLNLTIEELISGGNFKINIPLYNNTYYPLTKKMVELFLEPRIFPKSVISLSMYDQQPVRIQVNSITSNEKHISPFQDHIRYSYSLLGLNHIRIKLTVPFMCIDCNNYGNIKTTDVYINLPNSQCIQVPLSAIIEKLNEMTTTNGSDIDDYYYCLPDMGLKSFDGSFGNIYVRFSFTTLKYPKYPKYHKDPKYHREVIYPDNLISGSDTIQIYPRKEVEEKAYREKEQYLRTRRITHSSGVSITPVI